MIIVHDAFIAKVPILPLYPPILTNPCVQESPMIALVHATFPRLA